MLPPLGALPVCRHPIYYYYHFYIRLLFLLERRSFFWAMSKSFYVFLCYFILHHQAKYKKKIFCYTFKTISSTTRLCTNVNVAHPIVFISLCTFPHHHHIWLAGAHLYFLLLILLFSCVYTYAYMHTHTFRKDNVTFFI